MKTPIVLMIVTLSIYLSSCTKDGGSDNNGTTTSATSTTSTTSPVDSDYRTKYQGNYNCSGVETYYSSDTSIPPVTTNTEFVLTVLKQTGVDSGMTLSYSNFGSVAKILPDGTIDGEGDGVFEGKFVSPDSVYFTHSRTSHPGRTEVNAKGKK